MAEALKPSVEELDLNEIYKQWGDWCERMWDLETSHKSEREKLLMELTENMPKRLMELEACTKMFLENRLNVDDIFLMTVPAQKLLNSMEKVSANEEIESEQHHRLDRLKEKLTEVNIHGYWVCTKLIQDIQRLSHRSWSDLVNRTKETVERCKKERWPGTLLLLYKRMIKDVQLLKTRKPSSFEPLGEVKSLLENAIESILESESKAVLDPGTEYSHVCFDNTDVVVTFPSETVKMSQEIHITIEPVSIEECKFLLTEIAGYSDIINIQHDEEFQNPVTVTTPIVMIGDCHISSCDLFCVHIDDDGLTIDDDVKIEVLDGNLCRFATSTFSRNGLHARRKVKGNKKKNRTALLKELRKFHGASPHNILVFIGAGSEPHSWRLHAEVVDENDMKEIINIREQERSVFELPECRSRSFIIRGIKQIAVVLGSKGSLGMYNDSSHQGPIISIVHGGQNNYISFLFTRKNREKAAIVHFKAIGRKKMIHTAYFDPRELSRFPYPAKQYASTSTSLTKETVTGIVKPSCSDNEQLFTTVTPDPSIISSMESLPPLSLQRSEFFGDKSMLSFTKQISVDDMYEVAVLLGIPHVTYQDLKSSNPKELKMTIMKHWLSSQTCSGEEMLSILCHALENADLDGIAKVVAAVYKENRALEKADFQN